RRDADGHGIRRDVLRDDSVGPDDAVVADAQVAQDHDAAAYIDPVLDDRNVVQPVAAGDAHGGVLAQVAVVADGTGAEDHAAVVPKAHAPSQLRRIPQADTASPLDPLEQEAVEER